MSARPDPAPALSLHALSASQRVQALSAGLTEEAARTDPDATFPVDAMNALRRAGLLSAPVPQALGGEGLGQDGQTAELLRTLVAMGRASLVVGRLWEGHVNALQLIDRYGSAAQQRSAADDALQGHLFAVWNTEAPRQGLKLKAPPQAATDTPARVHPPGGTLLGGKTFASGVGHVSRALVTAAVDGAPGAGATPGSPTRTSDTTAATAATGWQMLLLRTDEQAPRTNPAFWKPLGMRSSGSHSADFSGQQVAPEALIGRLGDYYLEPAFSGGCLRFCAVQQGGIEAVFDETRRFLVALGRTGDAFQRARLGAMAWRVESGRLWLQGAARLYTAPPDAGAQDERALCDQRLAHARLLRSAIEDHAVQVMALSDRAVGARGLLQPEPFERLHRDLTHYLRQPAPDAALVEAGRHVLEDPRPASELWPC